MYAVSWSGDKDACLAAYKASQQGLKVGYLLVEERMARAMKTGEKGIPVEDVLKRHGL